MTGADDTAPATAAPDDAAPEDAAGAAPRPAKAPGGIQSLDAALSVLAAVRRRGGPVSLSDLARDCGMQPSKVHRYLASFMAAGLVAQTGRSGKYLLGPEAMALGLAALSRHDFVNRAADGLADLAAETEMTVLLSVWSAQGAVVIRWERAEAPAVTSMGLGSALPLLNSASGRVLLAWGPQAPLKGLVEAELRRLKKRPGLAPDMEPTAEGVRALRARIRAAGCATADGDFIPGLVAVAAPVLDWQGEAQCAVTLIGTEREATLEGAPARTALLRFCAERSVEGAPGAAGQG